MDLEAIRARHAAATAGPYTEDGYRVSAPDGTILAEMKHLPNYPICPSGADVSFYAAAWQDVADLLARVAELEQGAVVWDSEQQLYVRATNKTTLLLRRIKELGIALREYGAHDYECPKADSDDAQRCTCGLDAALKLWECA